MKDFEQWLDSKRGVNVSEVFHEIIEKYHTARVMCDTQKKNSEMWYEKVVELKAVLRDFLKVAPREVECKNMHHLKKDQHEHDETCPVVSRYAEAIANINKVLGNQ